MSQIAHQDSRSYFILPQAPEEAAYYTYGTPTRGRGQYAHPQMLTFIFSLEHQWGAIDNRKIGIGNISLTEGASFPPHRSHRSGLEVDMRPLRKDGKPLPVRFHDTQYDREATRKLVEAIWHTGVVKRVAFNDLAIPGVQMMTGHDDHLHVEIRS